MSLIVCLQAKYLAQIIVTGAQIVGRAFVKALQSEVRASQQAAQARSSGQPNVKSAAADSLTGMTLQVVNISVYSVQ
jgi:mitochondrial import inner membrane translocase subunit TIM16